MIEEKKRFIDSVIYPVVFVLIIWLVKIIETFYQTSFYQFGIEPKSVRGLQGIFFSPFIHGDFNHLISNTLPLLALGVALFYFYRSIAVKVFFFSWLVTGFWVWVMARPSFHIGASGLIYSLAGFLFASGVVRKHPRLMAISLLVVFIYGGMVWGIFPFKERVSWESHLMGLLCGLLLAYFFRQHGPQRAKYSWEIEEEMEELEELAASAAPDTDRISEHMMEPPENNHNKHSHTGEQTIRYIYKKKDNPRE